MLSCLLYFLSVNTEATLLQLQYHPVSFRFILANMSPVYLDQQYQIGLGEEGGERRWFIERRGKKETAPGKMSSPPLPLPGRRRRCCRQMWSSFATASSPLRHGARLPKPPSICATAKLAVLSRPSIRSTATRDEGRRRRRREAEAGVGVATGNRGGEGRRVDRRRWRRMADGEMRRRRGGGRRRRWLGFGGD